MCQNNYHLAQNNLYNKFLTNEVFIPEYAENELVSIKGRNLGFSHVKCLLFKVLPYPVFQFLLKKLITAVSIQTIKITLLYLVFSVFSIVCFGQNKPFEVDSLFDLSQSETLGLSFAEGVESFSVFVPGKEDLKYNHGVVLFPFKGMLYAQWQSSAKDEDGADTRVFYSRSKNGKKWSKPVALTKEWDKGIKTSGGWWSYGDTLIAYICEWPEVVEDKVKQGRTKYILSTDGLNWSGPKSVLDHTGNPVLGIIEQDLHALPQGRIITAFHMQPGLQVTPFYTDDPSGVRGWTKGNMENLPSQRTISREIEPSWFYRKDSAVVMVFRDQNSSFKKLASVSENEGVDWTKPVLIDTPDSRAKQSAGNLPDGTAFMVNNPSGCKQRFPLVVTLSKDGFVFDKAFLIRSGGSDLQPLKFEGKYKRVGYSYPKSVVWGKYLYVGYATNKEDVQVSRIPIKSLVY